MPTSHFRKAEAVLGILPRLERRPVAVLDIGVGFGKYGFLLREHLDIRKSRYFREEWQVVIDGVEVWEKYLTPAISYIYNEVYIGDIRSLIHTLGVYDLIVMADVIEHLPKYDGIEVLNTLYYEHCLGGITLSYPKGLGRGWEAWENPHEEHLSIWSAVDFDRLQINKDRILFPKVPGITYLLK